MTASSQPSRYEATLAEIRGHEGVREWKEGWVEARTEDEVWEGTIQRVTGARRVPQCMGSWEYKVEWEGGTRAIWEMAETLAGTDAEVQQQMKAAKDGPEHGSMYERVEADREGLTKVLAGRASCEEDREDEGAVKLWEILCKQAEAMGGGRSSRRQAW